MHTTEELIAVVLIGTKSDKEEERKVQSIKAHQWCKSTVSMAMASLESKSQVPKGEGVDS
jgi:hypothetical protein